MKLTKDLLIKLINEAMEHGGLSCNEVHPEHTHSEWEDHKKEEEKKTKAMAKISIKPVKKAPKKLSENIPAPPLGGSMHGLGDPRIEAAKAKCKEKGGELMGDVCQDPKTGKSINVGYGLRENEEDCVPKSELRDVLKTWMEKEYDSDEDRWREYGKDIQELVGDELKEG